MKSIFFATFFLVGMAIALQSQNLRADSLMRLLEKTPKDTNYVNLLAEIGLEYTFMEPDTALVYAKRALDMARDLHYTNGIMGTLTANGELLRLLGDYPGSLKMQFEALDLYRKIKDTSSEAETLAFIGITYMDFREYTQALQYLLQANHFIEHMPVEPMSIFTLSNIGNTYDLLGMPDSALYYQKQAQEKMKGSRRRYGALPTLILIGLGNIYKERGKTDSALQYYHQGLLNSSILTETIFLSKAQQKIAGIYESKHMYDSAMYYARRAFAQASYSAQKPDIMESAILLFKLHRTHNNTDSAFFYEDIVAAMKDSLYGPQKFRQLQLLMLDEQQQQQKIILDQEHYGIKLNTRHCFLHWAFY
jgi:two-component system NtrC family sensor kinase